MEGFNHYLPGITYPMSANSYNRQPNITCLAVCYSKYNWCLCTL